MHVGFCVCCSDCGNVCCVAAAVKDSVFSLGVLKYVCVRNVMDVVFCLYCEAWSCRCSCIGSVSVSSCRCMLVSCVYPVAVLSAVFCMICSLLIIIFIYLKSNIQCI